MTASQHPSQSPTAPRDENLPSGACFDAQVLSDFFLGKLSDGDLEANVARHVATCDPCERRLRQFAPDSLIRLLQSTHGALAVEEETFTRIQRNVAADDRQLREEASSTRAVTTPQSPRKSADLPVKLAEFFVIREVGKGGFGRVYLAKDTGRDRHVAIKVPTLQGSLAPEVREAFLAEARTIATLDHPHIVRLLDCRELDDGTFMLIMRYVDGRSLAAVLGNERIDARRAVEIVIQIADALHYAHQRRIWHRDVKPANIILDRQGAAFLADFGLAVNADDRTPNCDEAWAGTILYMSPEQFASEPIALDGRTDIWSLGIVLYELLAGRRPFDGKSAAAVRHQVRYAPHPPLQQVAPHIPPQLCTICDRCLSKAIDDRYETAEQFAADLRAFLDAPTRRRTRNRYLGLSAGALIAAVALFAAFQAYDGSDGDARSPASSNPASSNPASSGVAPIAEPNEQAARRTWRPMFGKPPKEITWNHNGLNDVQVDPALDRLVMRLEHSRGLVECDEHPTADFSVRYVIVLDKWQGRAGFYWGFQRNHAVFPERRFHCLCLNTFRKPEGTLHFEVVELRLEPTPYDASQLMCPHSLTLASGAVRQPVGAKIAITLKVERGKLAEVRVNDTPCAMTWNAPAPAWAATAPASYGFHLLNGFVTIENGTLRMEEFGNGEEE